jgi:sirohydrochlorin cobaltochelatase
MLRTAIVILGHGSRSESADDSIRQATARIKSKGGYEMVVHAFLQYASPRLSDVLEDCVRQQVAKAIVVPFFMQAGRTFRRYPRISQGREKIPHLELV